MTTTAPPRTRAAALATLLLAEAMNLLDTTIVQVAAPVMRAGLRGDAGDIQWFSAAYTLAFAVLLITGGRLGDIAGRRRIFRLGVAGFVLASLICALAVGPGMLIAARAVQGAGAALVIPQTIGLIKAMYAGPELGRAFGAIGPVMALSAVCGPILGGALTSANLFDTGWRAVFLVNIPFGLAVLACSRLLPEDRAPHRPRLDLPGTVLVTVGSGLLIYPLIEGTGWVLLVPGVLVLLGFAASQRNRRAPLVEPRLFGNRRFPAALLGSTLFFAAMQGLIQVIVLHLQLGEHAGSLASGLSLLPWSLAMGAASLLAGRLVVRYGDRVMFAGLLVLGAGVALALTGPAVLFTGLGIAGFGIGLFTASFFSSALAKVRPQENGSAAGLLNAVQQFGGTLGVAVLGSVFFAVFDGSAGSSLGGLRLAFASACVLVLGTALAVGLMRARTR
ncbi:MFS transporter [Sciscionella marina]|uniref:MFS transporter n=1 Tax=Sciscionella marina TaxID=508770 RepID=UPI00036B441C|nr:MFS transporter [Sciscionella marina]